MYLPWAYRDMLKLGEVIRSSGLDWTVVRIMSPNNNPSGNGYDVFTGKGKAKLSVSRENVAKFMYQVAMDMSYIKEMPVVFNR